MTLSVVTERVNVRAASWIANELTFDEFYREMDMSQSEAKKLFNNILKYVRQMI
jgi:hypothetical protein